MHSFKRTGNKAGLLEAVSEMGTKLQNNYFTA
jgi:hypothetical protein